jgi:hypothetical protein
MRATYATYRNGRGSDELMFIAVTDGLRTQLLFPEAVLSNAIDLQELRQMVGSRIDALFGGEDRSRPVAPRTLLMGLTANLVVNIVIHEPYYASYEAAVAGAREALGAESFPPFPEEEWLYELFDPIVPQPDTD